MAYNITKNDTMQMLLLKAQVNLPNINNKILNLDILDFSEIRPTQNHDASQVTKATKQVERDLAMSLLFIIDGIKRKDLRYSVEDSKNIEFIFRNHIQRAYQLGIAYVNNIFQTKGFIEERDLNVIKFLTDYYTQTFLNAIDKIINNPAFIFNMERSILDVQNDMLEKSNIFNYIAHSISATFQALQVSTIIKTVVLFDDNSIYQNDRTVFGAENIPSIQFYWGTSMGERNCPICIDLSKNTWSINEWNNIPLIPHGSHPHCRCRILIKQGLSSSLS